MKVTLPAAALWQGSKATQECSIGFLLTSALLMSVIWSSPPVGILFCLPVCQIGRPVSVFLHTKWAIVCPFVSECRPHAEEMWRVKTHMEQIGSASEYSQTDDSIPQLAKEKLTKLIVDDWKKEKRFLYTWSLYASCTCCCLPCFPVFVGKDRQEHLKHMPSCRFGTYAAYGRHRRSHSSKRKEEKTPKKRNRCCNVFSILLLKCIISSWSTFRVLL